MVLDRHPIRAGVRNKMWYPNGRSSIPDRIPKRISPWRPSRMSISMHPFAKLIQKERFVANPVFVMRRSVSLAYAN